MIRIKSILILTVTYVLLGCSDSGEEKLIGEKISRLPEDHLAIPSAAPLPPPLYPWENSGKSNLPKITKEYFRCKGNPLNPERTVEENGKMVRYTDCQGAERHSLPLSGQQEFIYPILLKLLNYLQEETGKKVVITSGHRCPEHNTYVDSSSYNRYSKHLIGAEVSFYVQGLEGQPEKIVEILMAYYGDQAFQRYEKEDTNVSTKPWYNQETFIKLFNKDEGRNFDNRHPYPYLSIQVRYDPTTNERVLYSDEKARLLLSK